ncbi:MAG: DUF1674 domain-containing protein [Micavibrio sp.]
MILQKQKTSAPKPSLPSKKTEAAESPAPPLEPLEKGGPAGPEPTRYGDWELNGKCVDF